MAEPGDWISVLNGIIRQMSTAGVTELEVHRGDLRLRLRRSPGEVAPRATGLTPAPEPLAEDRAGLHRICAPLTGVFYTSPNPTSKPYVAEGDWLEPDSVVGLIETMKVFNEVVADCRGRVTAIMAKQGQLVHTGEPLMLVDLTVAPDHSDEVRP
ncbi:MAG: acetyl-CoA carboxylase biotin carboxyl carrier protein [Sphingomonadaceae bacterium]